MEITHTDDNFITGSLVITKFKDGQKIWQSEPMKNKVVSSSGYGRNLIARRLAGDTTYGIEIDSASLGDSNTAPADGDTGLGNSLVSGISITNATVSNNQITIDVFASDGTIADDTYEEFGLFIGGRLFSRLVISPAYVKATGEDSLFTYTLTIAG